MSGKITPTKNLSGNQVEFQIPKSNWTTNKTIFFDLGVFLCTTPKLKLSFNYHMVKVMTTMMNFVMQTFIEFGADAANS